MTLYHAAMVWLILNELALLAVFTTDRRNHHGTD